MATSWETAAGSPRGLPPEVALVLDSHEALRGATLLLGAPEHQVRLPGGGHASQTDLWALLRTEAELVSMAIEGKAGEPRGEGVADWLDGAAPRSGKPERLRFLRERFGLSDAQVSGLRYQLLHRSVSALLEAERFTAKLAALVVQSFDPAGDAGSFSDFVAFGRCFAVELQLGVCPR